MANDLDKYAGGEYADPNEKIAKAKGTHKDKVDSIPMDEKLPIKAMPKTDREKPYKVRGGGEGG